MRRFALAAPAVGLVWLCFASAAEAHVIPQPAYLAAGKETQIQFVAPNERPPHLFTQLSVTMPEGIELHAVAPPEGWKLSVNGRTAVWSGGHVARGQGVLFSIGMSTHLAPGAITFRAVQRYNDGGLVPWNVGLTVLPEPAPAPKQHILPAIVTGILGVIVIALVLFRTRERQRSRRPLQEK